MKTVLRLAPHTTTRDANVVELWHDGVFIGTVVGADGPGVRIISKYITNSVNDILIRVADGPPVLEVTLRP